MSVQSEFIISDLSICNLFNMDETKYISDGIALGYEGAALNKCFG